ncbi:MAG: hypothetical protein J6Y08_07490 [Clostridiales bacterium]|nr:hypothetical protein [Clostridiales bacterium]
MTKRSAFSKILSFLLILSLCLSLCCCEDKAKKLEQYEKDAQDVIETYLIYLQKGKLDRLEKFADPDSDFFQEESDDENKQALLSAFLGAMQFKISGITPERTSATAKVKIEIPDGAAILKSVGVIFDLGTVEKKLENDPAMISEKFTVELEREKEKDDYVIVSTDEIYDFVMEQVDSVFEKMGADDIKDLAVNATDLAMKAIVDCDVEYVEEHVYSDGWEYFEFEEMYLALHEVYFSMLEYDIEGAELGDNEVYVTVSVTFPDSRHAGEALMKDSEALALSFSEIIPHLFQYSPQGALNDEDLHMENCIDAYKDYLEKAPDRMEELCFTAYVDSDGELILSADYDLIMPWEDLGECMDDMSDDEMFEFINNVFLSAARQLYEQKQIDEELYNTFLRNFGEDRIQPYEVIEVLEENGFEYQSMVGYVYDFFNGDATMYVLGDKCEVVIDMDDDFYYAYDNMYDYWEELSEGRSDPAFHGKLDGDLSFMKFYCESYEGIDELSNLTIWSVMVNDSIYHFIYHGDGKEAEEFIQDLIEKIGLLETA